MEFLSVSITPRRRRIVLCYIAISKLLVAKIAASKREEIQKKQILKTETRPDKIPEKKAKKTSRVKSKAKRVKTAKKIKKKVNAAYCLAGDVDDNTLMVLSEKLIFPILNRIKKQFNIS